MPDTSNKDCRILFDVLMAQGLRQVVLSPGSRNAPLLVAADAREDLNNYIITDERTAGFMALGMAMISRKPVMLVCTSGTALYNYAPAVAEAYYRRIPLIVVSADRPGRWIDQDDSQTLRQSGALDKIVKRSFNITLDEGARIATSGKLFSTERDWFVNRMVNEAWITATQAPQGPVHINLPIDNPLGETQLNYDPMPPRTIRVIDNPSNLPPEKLKEIALFLADKRVLVTAGFMSPDHRLSKALNEFLKLPNVTAMAEPISNLHLPEKYYMVDAVLHNFNAAICDELRPDVVISMGGALVSRMLKDFIRTNQPDEHWTLADADPGTDCFQSLTTHFNLSPLNFFRGVASLSRWLQRHGKMPENPEYDKAWDKYRTISKSINTGILRITPWSELTAFRILFEHMPGDCNAFFSNGTPIRYASLLMDHLPHGCYSNRGVSGIEGTSATALGCALNYSGLTLLVSGDMSFNYYPHIFGNPYFPDSFRIIVINNKGGGIFRFIKSTRNLHNREEYFCAPCETPLKQLSKAYSCYYFQASCETEMIETLPIFFSTPRAVMEILVDPEASATYLKGFLA